MQATLSILNSWLSDTFFVILFFSDFFKRLLNNIVNDSYETCKNEVDILGEKVGEVPSLAVLFSVLKKETDRFEAVFVVHLLTIAFH